MLQINELMSVALSNENGLSTTSLFEDKYEQVSVLKIQPHRNIKLMPEGGAELFVLQGSAIVWIDGVETLVKAPYIGITEPNTRRVLYILEDSIWATSHPNPDNENVEQIEDRIIEKHDNIYLDENIKIKLKELLNTNL